MLGGVYFAYPIDQRGPASLSYLFEQVERLKTTLVGGGLCKWAFDPGDAFMVNLQAEPDDSLPRINRAALNNSDLVIAFLPRDVASVGVPMEIDRAHSQGKHVMLFSDASRSWMLNLPHLWRANSWQEEAIEAAIDWITELEPRPVTRQTDDLLVQVGETGRMPSRNYADDAGFDLYVSEDTILDPGKFTDVKCDINVALPPHTWGMVTGRSSTLRDKGLLVHTGVIDAGYRGRLFAGAWNQTDQPVRVQRGERIAQLVIIHNATRNVVPVEVQELPGSARGSRGFGSSGA